MATGMHYGASKEIMLRAKYLRTRTTLAEQMLWDKLRLHLTGYKFRQQHPIHWYIVDFYCHTLRLVIEVDGPIHDDQFNAMNDDHREDHLRGFGLRILRFTNDDVYYELDAVLEKIRDFIRTITLEEGQADIPGYSRR